MTLKVSALQVLELKHICCLLSSCRGGEAQLLQNLRQRHLEHIIFLCYLNVLLQLLAFGNMLSFVGRQIIVINVLVVLGPLRMGLCRCLPVPRNHLALAGASWRQQLFLIRLKRFFEVIFNICNFSMNWLQ